MAGVTQEFRAGCCVQRTYNSGIVQLGSSDLAAFVGRAKERYVRTHRQGSMATVCAMILFDALRSDIERSERRQVTSFSRQQLRDAMAAHPAWEGKAFEDTSFNTVPEDLGEQLEQFVHDDFAEGRTWKARFAGPTRKFRTDKATRELFLEVVAEVLSEVIVEPAEAAAETNAPRPNRLKRWHWGAAGAVILALSTLLVAPHVRKEAVPGPPREQTLAVVPFRLLTPDPQLQFLGIGIADAVITRVSNLEPIHVRPTTAVLRYATEDRDLQSIGREVAADYVLAGTLQAARDSIRANVQLVRTSDGAAVWGQQVDVARDDLLALEDAIATRVAASLHVRLSEEHRARIARHITHVPAAYEHYLRGRAALLQLTKADTETAIREFEEAIALDPRYAAAHAGLANAAAQMRIRFAPAGESQRWAERAKEEASRAVELGPDLAEAHEALAAVYRFDEFDWERVMDESGRAIALNPDLELPHHYLGAAAFHLGLLDLAEREARIALDLNRTRPLEPLRILGVSALARGNWRAAEESLGEVRRRSDIGYFSEALALFHLGRRADAEALLREGGGGETRQARAAAVLASFLAATGRLPESRAVIDRAKGGLIDHHVAYSIGVAYAQLGDQKMAIMWLKRAIETGFPCYPFFVSDPLLAPLRNDVSFRALLHELELKHAQWQRKYR